MKAIIVDDSVEFRQSLKNLLTRSLGIEVVAEADDGEVVCDLVKSFSADILILDLYMPRKNGLDVLRDLKRGCMDIFIIIFTNYADSSVRNVCLELGAKYVFDKSTELEILIKTLEKFKESRPQTKWGI